MMNVYVLLVCLVLFIPSTKKSINKMDYSKEAREKCSSELVCDQHEISIWVKFLAVCARIKTKMAPKVILKRKFGSNQTQINGEFKENKFVIKSQASEFENKSFSKALPNKVHNLQNYLDKPTAARHCSQIVRLSAVQVK